MANSRNKGNKNEREVAKLWNAWTGKEFTRIPSSGGLRWNRTHNTTGDLICADEKHSRYFTFSIECKFHKEINFQHLILPNKSVKIIEFWNQAVEDSERAKRIPILFMRYNGMPANFHFVVLSEGYYNAILSKRLPTHRLMKLYGMPEAASDFVILASDDLFQLDYTELHKINKRWLKKTFTA